MKDSRPLDQADRLRRLAQPGDVHAAGIQPASFLPDVAAAPSRDQPPRIVLVSEFPGLQDAFPLAWHLAQELSQMAGPSLIIDLAPGASRLAWEISPIRQSRQPAPLRSLPLWNDSLHGRRLGTWASMPGCGVDVVSQPCGRYPTAEQMARLCEQLLRLISRSTTSPSGQPAFHWRTVLLLSECQGLPLDSVCWQAADELILLLPEVAGAGELLHASLMARVPQVDVAQRRVYLWRRAGWSLRPWFANSPLRPLDRSPQPSELSAGRHYRWPAPPWARRRAAGLGSRRPSVSRVAAQLASELGRIHLPNTPPVGKRTRQAG